MARCDLKLASTTRDNRGRLHIPVRDTVAASPPPSPEWQVAYNSLRNTNEGINGYIKDPAYEALDDPGRRRIHGVAAQSVLVAFVAVAANVRKIRAFVATSRTKRVRRPRRRTTQPLAHWRPEVAPVAVPDDPDPPTTA